MKTKLKPWTRIFSEKKAEVAVEKPIAETVPRDIFLRSKNRVFSEWKETFEILRNR